MKILKRILIGIVAIIAVLLLTALFVNKDYNVERSVSINKPKEQVFSFVKQARNQDQYNKWIQADPQVKKTYRGEDGTVGFVYAWESNEVGKGEQEISSIREGEQIDFALRFKEPFESNAAARMITETVADNQTKVSWRMEGSSPYPMNLMNLFVPSVLGKDLETSLANLKTVLEKQ
ncbi:SRPBCC family protein [Flavisolibacter sp. BT320]|nr:SRPBCC family protein [Flavisolibacter longurius]